MRNSFRGYQLSTDLLLWTALLFSYSCSVFVFVQEVNAYEQFLVAKCRKMFADFSAHTIAIYQPLTMQFWPLFEVRNKFLRKGLELHIHYEDVLRYKKT